MSSLTTGSTREGPRRVGGMRTALRTEQRRAERAGNTGLANALGGQIAEDNLRRAANGDSNIGSADSNMRESRAYDFLQRQQLDQQARLASAPAQPSAQPPATTTPITGATTPAASGTPAQPASVTAAPSTDTTAAGSAPATSPTVAGSSPASPPAPAAPAAPAAPDTLVRPSGGGRINGLPAAVAASQSEFAATRDAALKGGDVKAAVEFTNSKTFKDQVEYIRQRQGREAADAFEVEQSTAFFKDFGATHGFDAQLGLYEARQADRAARLSAMKTDSQFRGRNRRPEDAPLEDPGAGVEDTIAAARDITLSLPPRAPSAAADAARAVAREIDVAPVRDPRRPRPPAAAADVARSFARSLSAPTFAEVLTPPRDPRGPRAPIATQGLGRDFARELPGPTAAEATALPVPTRDPLSPRAPAAAPDVARAFARAIGTSYPASPAPELALTRNPRAPANAAEVARAFAREFEGPQLREAIRPATRRLQTLRPPVAPFRPRLSAARK